jgi:hypothetical protein
MPCDLIRYDLRMVEFVVECTATRMLDEARSISLALSGATQALFTLLHRPRPGI